MLTRSDCVHTACYCEENCYLLAERLVQQAPHTAASRVFVVFVSNTWKQVCHVCSHISREGGPCCCSFPDVKNSTYHTFTSGLAQVPFWCQTAGRGEGLLVFWDYHVLVVVQASNPSTNDHCLVWDLDRYCQHCISVVAALHSRV